MKVKKAVSGGGPRETEQRKNRHGQLILIAPLYVFGHEMHTTVVGWMARWSTDRVLRSNKPRLSLGCVDGLCTWAEQVSPLPHPPRAEPKGVCVCRGSVKRSCSRKEAFNRVQTKTKRERTLEGFFSQLVSVEGFIGTENPVQLAQSISANA